MESIKSFIAETPNLTTIPLKYTIKYPYDEALLVNSEIKIPTIDFSLLTSADANQRSKAIAELSLACQDWGFFMVINHGIPESVMNEVIAGCNEFFNLSEKEKSEYVGRHVLDPIRYGTSFNTSVDKVFYWRDYLKVIAHLDDQFHFPNKPSGFSEVAIDYCRRIKEVGNKILEGVSESLGFETNYIKKELNLKSGLQMFAANLYPPCPQPDLAMGMPPHSDHGLFTFLIQNGIDGLQIHHNGKWVNVNNPIPSSLLVNVCDQLEIVSNGKYKSVVHRAIVNSNATRISLAIVIGPDLQAVVSPAPELVQHNSPVLYTAMRYKDYLEIQQSNTLNGKSMLDRVRLA